MKTRKHTIRTAHVVVLALAAQLFAVAMGGDAPAVSKSVPEGWVEDFEAARLQAAKEGKYVLLAFSGSDWCGPCIALEREVLSQKAFTEELAKRFLLVMVSVPRDKSTMSELALTQNDGLKQRYGVHGFPTLVVVNPADGDAVKRMSGYRAGAPRGFMDRLNEMMDGVQWPEKGIAVKPLALSWAKADDRKREKGTLEPKDEPTFELRSGHVVFTGPKSLEQDIRATKNRYEAILPFARQIYGDVAFTNRPFLVRFKEGDGRGGYRPGLDEWSVTVGTKSCSWFWRGTIYYLVGSIHNGPKEPNWAFIAFYLDYFMKEAAGELRSISAQAAIDDILQGKYRDSAVSWMKSRLPHFAVFRELFEDAPAAFREYYKEKRRLFEEGVIGSKMSLSDEAAIFSRILGKDVFHVFLNHGIDVSREDTKVPLSDLTNNEPSFKDVKIKKGNDD